MTKAQKKEIKSIIISSIESLKSEIADLEERSKPVAPDISLGRLTRQEARQDQEISKSILQDCKIRLTKLEYAKDRVDTDEYGICRVCDDEIDYERLKLLPETIICMECTKEKN